MAQQSNIEESKLGTIESASSLSTKVKESFLAWLSDGHSKKYSPDVYLSCMDDVSSYLVHRKITVVDLWELTKFDLFKSVYSKAINDNLFKATNKETYIIFVQIGKAFLKFLKSKPNIRISSVAVQSTNQTDLHLTIKEAIVRVLETAPHGMTVEEIYNKIIAGGLYSFGAKKPIEIVRVQIERSCMNSNYTIHASEDCFRFVRKPKGEKVYFLVSSTLNDDVKKSSESMSAELKQAHCDSDNNDSSIYAQQNVRSKFKDWLSDFNSAWSNSTLDMFCSDALYLYNNDRGITLEEALTNNGGIEKAYNVLENHFMSNPRQTGTAATAAKEYIDTLKLFKKFLEERLPNLLQGDGVAPLTSQTTFSDSIVSVLKEDYSYGFNFDTTSIRLLAEKSGVVFDASIENALKSIMFCRKDDIYFLIDMVAGPEIRREIIGLAGEWLCHYGCFEVSELYARFVDKVNEKAIRNVDDFESFYKLINRCEIRCVASYGTRIARVHNKSVRDLSLEVAQKVIDIVHDEYSGTANEEDLQNGFSAFSADLLCNIIKEHAAEIVKTEINGIVCYQTLDALGLSDEFSDTLTDVLEQIDEVGLIPNEEVLHTALSIRLGVNFKVEYNIPDDKTYRRLIATYYKGALRREWKRSIFSEV